MPDRAAEWRQLERFRRVYRSFPIGEIEHIEAPDFRVRTSDGYLGIELTQLFHPHDNQAPPPIALSKARQALLRSAEGLFTGLDQRPLAVSLSIDPNWHPEPGAIDKLARFLAQTVSSLRLTVGGSQVLAGGIGPLEEESAKPVHELRVYYFEGSDETFWASPEFGWRQDLSIAHLQAAIDRKNALVPTYRAKASTLWLLLVSDSGQLSTAFALPDTVAAHSFVSEFDRIILFDALRGGFAQLQITGLSDQGRSATGVVTGHSIPPGCDSRAACGAGC